MDSKNGYERSLHKNEEDGGSFVFSHEELEKATNNFKKQIGQGGYEAVYLGQLQDKRTVAVKTIPDRNPRIVKQFKNEVDIVSRIRHNNLNVFYGSIVPSTKQHESLFFVYEFVPNRRVNDHLHGQGLLFKWSSRIQIAMETAEALTYLHSMVPPIIHRDVKSDKTSSSIMTFTSNLRILAHLCSSLDNTDVVIITPGAAGYQDPEYKHNSLTRPMYIASEWYCISRAHIMKTSYRCWRAA